MKPLRIFGEAIIDPKAIHQMHEAMDAPFAVQGALMPDAHLGYSLPIGGVVATDGVVVPAWVGYDIGCGMCAVKTTFKPYHVREHADEIMAAVYEMVPVGFRHHKLEQLWGMGQFFYGMGLERECTPWLMQTFDETGGLTQLGTLGSGNHFIEIGVGIDQKVWITVHSGSRNVGHKAATKYMQMASLTGRASEGNFGLSIHDSAGQWYLKDMRFCQNFALANRKHLVELTASAISRCGLSGWIDSNVINRNHNHAEVQLDGRVIHRKGATHAENGMMGVIPGNMRDGVWIVSGKGNPDSLCSSSHGAGRVLSRKQAKATTSLKAMQEMMQGVTCNVNEGVLDEGPNAYKNILNVLMYQHELIDVVEHISPIINIKG